MRRCLFVIGLFALFAAFTARAAHAQNVQGLSLRAGEALAGSPSGTVDIVGDGTSATVQVDLSGAAETMKIADFKDAKSFVVWAVDMDGYRHNLGSLSDELKLSDVKVDYRVARVYVTAEADAKATAPTGDPLYAVTLRSVTEKDGAPAGESMASSAASSSTASSSSSAASSSVASSSAASSSAASSSAPAAAAAKTTSSSSAKPANLPTTGGGMPDLLVLAAAAMALLAVGARLAAVRA
ncbi:MAG: hypothetical protein ABI780_05880 [Ardenticatenales bacterium]